MYMYSFYCKCIIINPYHTTCCMGHEQISPCLKFFVSNVGQEELKLDWLSNFKIPVFVLLLIVVKERSNFTICYEIQVFVVPSVALDCQQHIWFGIFSQWS